MSSALAEPWTPPGLWVPPRYATPRDPSRQTTGPGVAKVARALGLPLMPWQLYVATVAGEVWPRGTVIDGEDVSGQYVYGIVIVTVPRQSGKSALMLAKKVHRCLAKPDQQTWFTAQTGKDATDLYRPFVGRVQRSPLAPLILGKPAFRGGSEALTFTNGSAFRPFAPGREALHGKQSDDVDIDEAWAFDEAQGSDLTQAIAPTQTTRPGAQTWKWSTRGDASSTWFHGAVAEALAGAPGVAIFDWGIPDGAPVDLDTLAAHHPAVGHTQTRSSLRAAIAQIGEDKPAEIARALGNRATGGRVTIIPAAAVEAATLTVDVPGGAPAYGVYVYEPRDGGAVTGALVAAVLDEDGAPMLEVIEHRPGRTWLVDRVLDLRDSGQGVAIDRRGPAGPVADALELAGVELLTPSGVDYAAACQSFFDLITHRETDPETGEDRWAPGLWVREDPRMAAAVDVAGRRFIGEGAWVWAAKESSGDIAVLAAGTLAAWAVARAETPVVIERPMFSAAS